MNRRNAVLGWAVWKIATNVAKSKAKRAAPGKNTGKARLIKRAAIVGVGFAAVTGAAAMFWRKKNDDTPPADV